MNIRFLVIAVLSVGLLSCAGVNRHPESGYSNIRRTNYGERDPSSVPRQFSPRKMKRESDFKYLRKLESKLSSRREKEQYYSYQTYFKSTQDKIKFLRKGSMAARSKYMEQRVFRRKRRPYSKTTLKLIEKRDISLGMTKDEIKQSWGTPDDIAYAGDAMYGNERWKYNRRLKTPNGYQDQSRQVFFEGGRVSGWKTN